MDDACDIRIAGNNRILAKEVSKNGNEKRGYFYCPECNSPVFLTYKGIYHRIIFEHEHSNIAEKTEIQKKCSRYTNKEDKQVYEPIDSYKIADAIPLYLAGSKNFFSLKAYFPPISFQTRQILQNKNARVYISQKKSETICLTVEDVLDYPIKMACKEALIVEIRDRDGNPIANIPEEVKRKWLCGISGLQWEKDVFRSWKDGGMRVAKKGVIYIGTTYRILRRNYSFLQEISISGVKVNNVGELCLDEQFIVYEITPTVVTDKSIQFFQERGYILQERTDEIFPIWPPAAAFGRDWIYRDNKALFLHRTSLLNEKMNRVYSLENNRIQEIPKDRRMKVNDKMEILQVSLSADISQPIMLGGELTPMLYDVQQNPAIFFRKTLLKEENIYDKSHQRISDIATNKIPQGGSITIETNLPVRIRVQRGQYVLFSNYKTGYVDFLQYEVDLYVDYGAWGRDKYSFRNTRRLVGRTGYYQQLLFCRGKSIVMNCRVERIIHHLQRRLHGENKQLYAQIQQWMFTRSLPSSALPILLELDHALQQEE